jgi:hypothetical protein
MLQIQKLTSTTSQPLAREELLQAVLALAVKNLSLKADMEAVAAHTATPEKQKKFAAIMGELKNSLKSKTDGQTNDTEVDHSSVGDDASEISGDVTRRESDSEDDDGYIPPHWMVDDNIRGLSQSR